MEPNEYLIRISGKVAIEPKKLDLSKEVEVTLKGTIVEIKHQDTNEGTEDIVYVIKPTEAKVK